MSDKPILDTARALLKFKGGTTISEIARMAGVKPLKVLKVLNDNLEHIKRNTAGKILSVHPEKTLEMELHRSDRYYLINDFGAYCKEGEQISFHGHEELRASLLRKHVTGGLGDSYTIEIIEATPENIKAVKQAGMVTWDELKREISDRLWRE